MTQLQSGHRIGVHSGQAAIRVGGKGGTKAHSATAMGKEQIEGPSADDAGELELFVRAAHIPASFRLSQAQRIPIVRFPSSRDIYLRSIFVLVKPLPASAFHLARNGRKSKKKRQHDRQNVFHLLYSPSQPGLPFFASWGSIILPPNSLGAGADFFSILFSRLVSLPKKF